MTTADPIPAQVPVLRQREAFASLQGALQALDAEGLPRINIDIRQSVVTVLGCMPEILALAPRLAEVPKVDAQLFAKLETYALGLGHANTQFLAASQPTEPVAELTEQLREFVDRLYSDASALAKRGLIDGSRLALLAGTNGAKNTAASAFLLVELFRMNWSRIVGKSAVAITELDEAEVLANRLETAVGLRDQAPSGAPEAAMARLKMHALFIRTYDEVRRVIGFLRWREGDVDQIAPSLHAARGRRSSSTELEAEPVEGGAQTGAGAVPVPAGGGAAAAAAVTALGVASSPFTDG